MNLQFTPVYQETENGIAGYDLKSVRDRAFPFDYEHTGNLDHIVFYRPGTGKISIVKSKNGFHPVYQEDGRGAGIGGYDLKSIRDRIVPFDYDHSGKLDHLVLYRPGTGKISVLKNDHSAFSAVYKQGDPGVGIGGYDLKSSADTAIPFDYEHSGKLDYLLFYRPGTGTVWILKNVSGAFVAVYRQGDPGRGIGGCDLKSASDKIYTFDFDHRRRQDALIIYRSDTGTVWILRNNHGAFNIVHQQVLAPEVNSSNILFGYDYDGAGRSDHLAIYRPTDGSMGVFKENGGTFEKVYEGRLSNKIGGYTFSSSDTIFCFDCNSTGLLDDLVIYRPGKGGIWILRKEVY